MVEAAGVGQAAPYNPPMAQPAPHVAELVELASVNLPTFSHDLFPQHYFVAQALLFLDHLDTADDLSARLQKGLFEEEANRNLDAAIQAYQSVVTQFDKDRQLAAFEKRLGFPGFAAKCA